MPIPVQFETPRDRAYAAFTFHIILNDISAAADVITQFTPGFVGSIVKTFFVVGTPASTADKLFTLTWEIGDINVDGGTIALSSVAPSNCTPLGNVVASAAITGRNNFDRDDTISLKASSVTQFTQGEGTVVLICAVEVY